MRRPNKEERELLERPANNANTYRCERLHTYDRRTGIETTWEMVFFEDGTKAWRWKCDEPGLDALLRRV